MMILTTSILAAPLMLLVWAADVFIFLASARLVLSRLIDDPQSPWVIAMSRLTDGAPQRVE